MTAWLNHLPRTPNDAIPINMSNYGVSRRSFLAVAGAAPIVLSSAAAKKIPIGLELYSVRDELAKDLPGTVTRVAKMGYEVLEFYAPYFAWTIEQAEEVRKLMDGLGLRCNSTHNSATGRN